MKYQNINATEQAVKVCTGLMAECTDIDSYVRSSGEALAVYDNGWKNARTGGGDVDAAIADFMLAGLVHLDALDMAGLREDALGTMLTMLVSVDMAGVSRTGLGMSYMELQLHYARACVELCARSAGDDFAAAHAGAILGMELALYAGAYDEFVEAYSPEAADILSLTGMREAAGRYKAADGDGGSAVADIQRPAEALIDMMARLNALGL